MSSAVAQSLEITPVRIDGESAVLSSRRAVAAAKFSEEGWPTTRQEAWKYTSLAAVARVAWRSDDGPHAVDALADPEMRARAAFELTFLNGHLVATDDRALPTGVRVEALHAAMASSDDTLEPWLLGPAAEGLTALNDALVTGGAVISIADGVVLNGFIHLNFIGRGDGIWSHVRNLIVAGANSQITVVESYSGTGNYFTNVVTQLFAGEAAVVDHYRLECEGPEAFHVGSVDITQSRASAVTARNVSLGGALVRNDVRSSLAGEGASVSLDGLFVLRNAQHVDNHTVIDHVKPHCESHELYKGILDDRSRGIFDGTIIVRPDAVKTSSRQVNHNILLSETATIDSKPTLEIHNDDVKCNHGSTIGQLNEESLFYLRARGIGEAEARSLLTYAFAREIIDRMPVDAVRERIGRALFTQMPDRLPERRDSDR